MRIKRGSFCRFYKDLYWGNSVKNRALVKWKLKMGSGQFGIYCVTKAMGMGGQLDIINSAFLKQKYYRYNPVLVYGIAEGYEEAVELVLRISQEASIAGFDGKLAEFLETKYKK